MLKLERTIRTPGDWLNYIAWVAGELGDVECRVFRHSTVCVAFHGKFKSFEGIIVVARGVWAARFAALLY